MKVSRQKEAANRQNVVTTAGRVFREHGFCGISMPELLATAGLTVGGFYNQFASKESLFGEVVEAVLTEAAGSVEHVLAEPDGATSLGHAFLAETRTRACPIVNLAAEISRHNSTIQKHFAAGLRRLLGVSKAVVGTKRWNEHTAYMAVLIGARVMVNAVRQGDRDVADAIIHAGLTRFNEMSTLNRA